MSVKHVAFDENSRSHATHMFVKKKYPPGHVFLHEAGTDVKFVMVNCQET